MGPTREDIQFEPMVPGDPYIPALLGYSSEPEDTEIDFGWRIYVRGLPFGMCWVDIEPPYGFIHGLTAVHGRYVSFVSREAFLLCESAAKSLGLIPAVVYPKEHLHVKRLCDIVGYKSVSLDDSPDGSGHKTMFATAR